MESSNTIAKVALTLQPGIKILARVRNRQHAYEMIALGVPDVYRETFESSMKLARDALRQLEIPDEVANQRLDLFRRKDIELLHTVVEHRHDQEKLMEMAKRARQELASLIAADEKARGEQ